jgi:hypothetical protein
MARQRYYFSDKLAARKARRVKICVLALLLIAASATSAWSHENRSSDGLPAQAGVASSSLPSSVTDSCLPLLKSIRHITPENVSDETRRPAGS